MKILARENYEIAANPLKGVTINNLFARSVVEKHVSGNIYVDNLEGPNIFYVVHPYGMSLLYGEINDNYILGKVKNYLLGNNELRQKEEWLQIFPTEWETKIDAMLGKNIISSDDNCSKVEKENNIRVVKHTRVNFCFNRSKYEIFKKENITEQYEIVKTNSSLFSEMDGSVVPKKFWNNEIDFAKRGIGFSLINNGKLITTAFSAFIHENQLELGMETKPEYRKKGFAKYVCAKLIDYCIENGYEPVWACRFGNSSSFYLAEKLGFEPTKYLPYYELKIR